MRQLVIAFIAFTICVSAASAGRFPNSAHSWAGLYYGTSIGGIWGNADTSSADGKPTGGTAGGQIGYNWQANGIVLGVEGDLMLATADDPVGPGLPERFEVKGSGALRAKLGYDFGGTLIYGAAGLAAADVEIDDDTTTATDIFWGWTVGAGAETKITSHLALRADYRYADFGEKMMTVDSGTVPVDITAHQFTVGFNYYLGEGASPLSLLSFAAPSVADWSGFYFGGVTGLVWADGSQDLLVNDYDGNFKFNGWTAGIRAGHDWQTGAFVYGLVADFSLSDAGERGVGIDNLLDLERIELNYFGTVRARAGLAYGHTLFYATGGAAVAGLEPYDDGDSDTKGMWGWTVGGGVETFIAEHQSLSLEYLYADFGEKTFLVDNGERKIDLTSSILRAGVSQRF